MRRRRIQLGHGRLALWRQSEVGELKLTALGIRTDHIALFGFQERQSLRTRAVSVDTHDGDGERSLSAARQTEQLESTALQRTTGVNGWK